MTLRGREITIICRPTKLTLADGRFWVIGQTVEAWDNATVEAGGNATVKAWGNATVEAWGNATVKAWGNATVKAGGNATVKAGGNATVVYPATWWHNKVNTDLKDKAVLIDRRDGRLVVSSPAEIQVIKCETPDAGE